MDLARRAVPEGVEAGEVLAVVEAGDDQQARDVAAETAAGVQCRISGEEVFGEFGDRFVDLARGVGGDRVWGGFDQGGRLSCIEEGEGELLDAGDDGDPDLRAVGCGASGDGGGWVGGAGGAGQPVVERDQDLSEDASGAELTLLEVTPVDGAGRPIYGAFAVSITRSKYRTSDERGPSVKLDLLYEIDVPKPWGPKPHPYGQREHEQRAYAEALEQIRLADRLGFHTSWQVEHHFREGRSHCPAPEVLIGALSQATENIRLGFGVTLLPHAFTPPMRVAEKVATADILSGGRVEWGTGRSTPMEQTAFGVDREQSREQWQEAIDAIVRMWEDEYFEYHGKYLDFPRRMVTPKPVQDPHPPCWMAATSDGSAAVAGSLGLGLLSFSIMQPIERMAQQIAQYRAAAANPTPITRVTTEKVAAYTLVHCADSMAQCEANGIWESVRWWYTNLAMFTLEWELPHLSPAEQDQTFPLLKPMLEGEVDTKAFSDADMIIVGDPDMCYEKMVKYAELGVDQLICYVQFGHLEHASIMRTIELLGTEILPAIEKAGIQTDVSVSATSPT